MTQGRGEDRTRRAITGQLEFTRGQRQQTRKCPWPGTAPNGRFLTSRGKASLRLVFTPDSIIGPPWHVKAKMNAWRRPWHTRDGYLRFFRLFLIPGKDFRPKKPFSERNYSNYSLNLSFANSYIDRVSFHFSRFLPLPVNTWPFSHIMLL